ncbi:hypothetical protein [Mesorhizobium sp.]|nr:hypothetical protein [Mesorhizobium sp.]RWH49995.1 MAG: hypothetical protein EOQ80_05335 [Mesorhizobium sp.]RWH57591.1 MAG: hypothetical protein EOQ82_08545 [Mesorhizobium sp.]RWI76903.1 MAG: hypothetical protein EOR19_14765 [Mesorhizobium sp.]RWJ44253.1 MAG: hypothetical protein EOR31_20845 [Mesorhizobium sp.]TIM56385.1 MAG: hypothetical protein E5Y46_13015 [Mesorhizobium sp.]
MVVRFFDRKKEFKAALIRAAKDREFPLTYERFGERLGIWRMRGAKDVLDLIAQEETREGRSPSS